MNTRRGEVVIIVRKELMSKGVGGPPILRNCPVEDEWISELATE